MTGCDCRQTMGETITKDCGLHRSDEDVAESMAGLTKLLGESTYFQSEDGKSITE